MRACTRVRHSRGKRSRAPSAPGRPPAQSHITRCRPATERRHPGMRTRSGPLLCQPGEDGGADRGEETSPPPLPATLTHRRPTGPRPAPTTARLPRLHVYTPGGAPETKGDRDGGHRPPHRAGGRGTAARPPLPSPPRSPPAPPPGPRGRPPSPRRTVTPGGGRRWIRTPRAPAPSTACSRGGRDQRANPRQCARTTHGPRPGAARDDEPEQ